LRWRRWWRHSHTDAYADTHANSDADTDTYADAERDELPGYERHRGQRIRSARESQLSRLEQHS
jgi:hypothetical protein